ncbi:MAG: hypothetical protein IKI59_07455 [Clostridia bacterium]|nr:hypothetical protein [Clostridia bacterium]
MATYVTRPPIQSGVPLGGIGTGSVELRPDGEFHAWQIANPTRFRRDCRKEPDADDGEGLTGSLSFALRTETGDGVLLRRLGFGAGDNNARMYSFAKPVSAIEYRGTFPTVSLSYRDDALPVAVTLEAAAPFVPYEADIAGTPGFFLTFSVRNRSKAPVRIALWGKLKSIVSAGADSCSRRCRVLRQDGRTTILTESAVDTADAPGRGSLALSAAGRDISFLSGEYRGYMDEFVAHGTLGVSEESALFGLYRTGRLPDMAQPARLDTALLQVDPNTLSDEAARALWDTLVKQPCAASIAERLRQGAGERMENPAFLREALAYLLKNLRELDAGAWGDGALCVHETLAPGEAVQIPFVLSWCFPSLYSASGAFVGHRYAVRFRDTAEVGTYLWQSRPEILQKVRAFVNTLYTGSFPEVFPDAVSIHLSTLVKSSWWAENGDFGVWEGLGSCGLHTTDISYHGTFGLCALFPDLQLRQMRMTAAHMRPDGAIPHFFSPDFSAVDNGFDRVDLNPQFVLLVCRDWLATGDRAQLTALWPAVCAAMDRTQSLDRNGDGLPDTETQRNTYDAWRFSGTPIYVAVLWLAALKAAARLADDLGEPDRAAAWRTLLSRGADAAKRLWNGAYFDLWHDGAERDECCMTDQLDGECFCRLIRLGGIFDDATVQQTLDTVWRTNFSPERGLINAGCPAGKRTTLYTCRNCQGEANWSGIEYWFAAFLLLTGAYENGLQLVQTVQERYERLGQMWNHAECGDFYYRPLSSFALLSALSGFSYDAPAETLRFTVGAATSFTAPFFTSQGFGTVTAAPRSRTLMVAQGALTVRRILLPDGAVPASLTQGGKPVPFTVSAADDGVALAFAPLTIKEGQPLQVTFR